MEEKNRVCYIEKKTSQKKKEKKPKNKMKIIEMESINFI